ncbi:Dda-like helicase [Pseudomonas phage DL60]|uniref:DNA helicase n=1 Tax=Pseudomonas phage DL60 TaxID=1640970 RepID=A0A0F6WD73_9CAUD|nr:Dda-like helicase [Pseudomonas phage DL60]AKF13865.1 DNA helicase [Pseudomonas phage DL60]
MSASSFTVDQIEERFNFRPNSQQIDAINSVVDWYRGWCDRAHRRQVYRLAGFAGTGKTSIAKIIAELCCSMDWTVFIAPTGKAAARLREKGCVNARTLHSFIYRPVGEDEDGEIMFANKDSLDEKPKLVVLDESSMIGEWDEDRLLSHRIPVLEIGDFGQVPPVRGVQIFHENSCDTIMTEIERNAGNIVRASMFVRQGKRLPCREYDDIVVRAGFDMSDDEMRTFLDNDGVILCAYNNTRRRLNARARRILGYKGAQPGIGEKLVCTGNQHEYGIMNGEQAILLDFKPVPEGQEDDDEPDEMLFAKVRIIGTNYERWVKFNPLSFSVEEDVRLEAQKAIGGFDFGWAMTFHKSQGSEWKRVAMLEENLPSIPYSQLMYTGITRAIEYLLFLRKS